MATLQTNSLVNVKTCSKCRDATEYFCHTCQQDFCFNCMEKHAISMDKNYHNFGIYREKYKKKETCPQHPSQLYDRFCKTCDIPVCYMCRKHRKHELLNLRTVYKEKLRLCKNIIMSVKNKTSYERNMQGRRFDECTKLIRNIQIEMTEKGQQLKDEVSKISGDVQCSHSCLNQKILMINYIARIENICLHVEQNLKRPVQFLRYLKGNPKQQTLRKIKLRRHCILIFNQKLIVEDVLELFSKIEIKKKENQVAKNELMLETLLKPVLKRSFKVQHVVRCDHISCAMKDRLWISDDRNHLVLINAATGERLQYVTRLCYPYFGWRFGFHTVSHKCELIYIGEDFNIKNLSNDLQTTSTFIKETELNWEPKCTHSCRSSGDLLVAMQSYDVNKNRNRGIVIRFDSSGKAKFTIPHQQKRSDLYCEPVCITENYNGDVIVSDAALGALVGTTSGGTYRFNYEGPPSKFKLNPLGICVDKQSRILVCDDATQTVQLISKDGSYLKFLLWNHSEGILGPFSVNLDVKGTTLFVGSAINNTVAVFGYHYSTISGKFE